MRLRQQNGNGLCYDIPMNVWSISLLLAGVGLLAMGATMAIVGDVVTVEGIRQSDTALVGHLVRLKAAGTIIAGIAIPVLAIGTDIWLTRRQQISNKLL